MIWELVERKRSAGANDPIGRRLRRLRKREGMTMGDLADELGLDVAHVSDVERGRKPPCLALLAWEGRVLSQRLS